ncbi:MAG: aspartoacylase [Chlorogloeopsis fritschii C42_A2020_084]|uniref:aspartoacylase n=1 Tax=Chlorogloeopsis fritschii TaxID=1124 RepID=UPI0019E32DC5|nr:aspartoacylase [Chlorogloeopsis fritschii]MBF2006511.1 aspartoacylase [Chlorogloeopsis fritschii C42_A2020_084]
MNQINRVAIVGGTHGNELTGVYLIKKFERFPQLIQRSSFETLTLLANPQAFKKNRRYIDKDLNRCFLNQDLQNSSLSSYEDIRAKVINQMLGPKGKSQVDVIVDLHSTTANMGLSLILDTQHPFMMQLAAYLCSLNPLVKICCPQVDKESSFLRSLCPFGFVIEVGSVAQGLLNADLFQKTEQLIYTVLDYLEAYNQGFISPTNSTFNLFEYVETIDYPRDENGEIQAMIHPQLHFQDYEPLNPGDPMFLTFDGKEITYQGESIFYPIFINEAAYYEKGIAMCLTKKQLIKV